MPNSDLGSFLKKIYNLGDYNKGEVCHATAVGVAMALTSDNEPIAVGPNDTGDEYYDNHKSKKIKKFEAGANRGQEAWKWLMELAQPGHVFAVHADSDDDHSYNFVKGPTGSLYLIDATQPIHAKVSGPEQMIYPLGSGGVKSDKYTMNYIDPVLDDESEDDGMKIYDFGPIRQKYHKFFP